MVEVLYSPMEGTVVDLDSVNDEVFSRRLLGDGIAIIPKSRKIYSPVDGEITMVYKTKHAIGIRTHFGCDILIHMGIDTVLLNGIPFATKVKIGDQVTKGDLLTVVNWNYIKIKGYDTVVPIIIINRKVKPIKLSGKVKPCEPLLEIED